MDDDGDEDDTKRRTRNLSEKKRRDQFNILVNELSSMLSSGTRKLDKSTVLKMTISFLKNYNERTAKSCAYDIDEKWKPPSLSNEEFKYLMLDALEGFIMVVSSTGQIIYASENFTFLLGYSAAEIANKNIFDIASDDDKPSLYSLLQNHGTVSNSSQTINDENEIRFPCHLRRRSPSIRNEVEYELIQFKGHFNSKLDLANESALPGLKRDQESKLHFLCGGFFQTPQLLRDVSLFDSTRCEFTSRFSLEWKFLFLDNRAPAIIGYLPFELLGTSGYDYYHFDDLEKVTACHEALMQKGEMTSCYYRFLTKGQQWIWLQTRFYITYHQWHCKPEFVVCTHRVVNYADITQDANEVVNDTETTMESDNNQMTVQENPPEEAMDVTISPSYMSEASDVYANSMLNVSRAPSVKSAGSPSGTMMPAASTGAVWPYETYVGRDPCLETAAGHGSSRPGTSTDSNKWLDPSVMPQHDICAQYLEQLPYPEAMGAGAVGVPAMLPVPVNTMPVNTMPVNTMPVNTMPVNTMPVNTMPVNTMPVNTMPVNTMPVNTMPATVTSEPAQEQLQQKHEELQQMIVRQQEELRLVKEQLLLARLGILQPFGNVQQPYVPNVPEVTDGQRVPVEIIYEETNPPNYEHGYPALLPPNDPPGHPPNMQ